MIGDGVAWAVRHLLTGSLRRLAPRCSASCTRAGDYRVHQTTLAIDMQMIQSMGGTPVWR